MFLTPAMYVDVVRGLPWDELLIEPSTSNLEARSQYSGQAPLKLIDAVQRAAAAEGIKPDGVLEAALQLWLEQTDG